MECTSIRVTFNHTKIYTMVCVFFLFFYFFFVLLFLIRLFDFFFFFFGKSHIYSTLYLIMKFLGYIIYLIANLNDFMIKFCFNNLKNYVIYLWGFFFFFFLNGSLLTYVVRIFFWRSTK